MALASGGNVGIGTVSPAQLLTVSSSSADAVVAIDCSYANGDALLILESANNRDSMIRFTEADTLKWQIYNDGTDDALKIQDDGDVRVTFDQSGDVTFAGDIIFGTAGKGICLGVTSNTDSNTLDDYEEGTWTILMKDGSANALSHDNDLGSYVKVGNLVHISVYTNINGLGSASGGVTIHGLPFTCGNGTQFYSNLTFCAGANLALPTAGDVPDAYVNANASTASCNLWTETTGAVALTAAHISDDGSFVISGAYHAA
jgi:hypothetical protein